MQKKDKIQLGITGVLVMILLVFVIRGIGGKKRTKKSINTNKSSQKKIAAKEGDEGKSSFAKLEEETQKLEFKRDPFSRQMILSSASSHDLNLSGIAWDEENPTAIINGQVVAVGQQIDGRIVIYITKYSVVIKDGTQRIILRLGIK